MLAKLVRQSRVRLGKNQFRGLPAVFVGAAAIVGAWGVATAMRRAAIAMPEFVRETRELMLAMRERHRLPP